MKSTKLKRSAISLRVKLKIGEDSIGPGKAMLLKKIEETGSISAAARDMGINYRRAWFLLETINKALGQPCVITSKGGRDGGGAALTQVGTAILNTYEDCRAAADTSTAPLLENLHHSLSETE